MKKTILVALLIFTLPFISTSQPAKLGIFDATADWGLEPEFPPKRGQYKVPGRVEVSEVDGDYVYDIYGNGDNIFNKNDEGFIVFAEWTGSWSISGKLRWIEDGKPNDNEWGKFNLVIRENGASTSSKFYSLNLRSGAKEQLGDWVKPHYRILDGENAASSLVVVDENGNLVSDQGNGIYFRVSRIASIQTFVSEWSYDGIHWNFAHKIKLDMAESVAYGFEITNHADNDQLAHARVSEVKLEPAPPIAERKLPGKTFLPGTNTKVRLEIFNPQEILKDITVVDHIPDRCSVSEVSTDGKINSGTISWNYNAPPGLSELTYTLTMPNDFNEVAFFQGKANSIPIFGDEYLEPERLKLTNKKIGVWRFWSTENELSESYSDSVYSAFDGKIWVKHNNSQYILDGYEVSHAHEPDGNYRVKVSPDGQPWSLHPEGFQRFLDGEWIPHKIEGFNINPTSYASVYFPLNHHQVLYVYPDRLMQYDTATNSNTVVKYATETSLIRFKRFNPAKDGGVWVQAYKGLGKINVRDGKIDDSSTWVEYLFPNHFSIQRHSFLVESDKGELFLKVERNGQNFMVHFDFNRWRLLYIDSRTNMDVYVWDGLDNSFWIENYNDIGLLLTRVYPDRELTIEQNRYFSGNFNSVFIEDRGVFMGGTQGGLYRYSPGTWQTPSSLIGLNNTVRSIAEDNKGGIWFLSKRQIHRLHNQILKTSNQNISPQTDISIPLFLLPNGNIMMNERMPFFQSFKIFDNQLEQKLINAHINGEFQDIFPLDKNKYLVSYKSDNNISLFNFDGERFDLLFSANGWSETAGRTRTMFQTPDEKIWFGTENGLWVIDASEEKTFSKVESYPGNSALVHLVLANGNVWLGGRDKIFEYDGSTWTLVKSGGFGNVNSMIQTKKGYVLVGASTGVHRYFEGTWNLNDGNDGLPNAEVYSIFQDSQNRIWAGTTVGVSLYHPEDDTDPPKSYIPENQNQGTVPPGGEVNFVVTGMDKWKYTEKEQLLYSHKVDGNPWSPYTADIVISVTGLSAGAHKFEARSLDRNWNISEPVEWQFEVLLPWYKQSGFLVISAIGSIITLFFIVLSINRHRQVVKAYATAHDFNSKLEETNDELSTANESLQEANAQLQELDKMKSSFVSQASHDLRTPLTTIKLNLDNLLRGIGGGLSEKQEKVTIRMHTAVNRLTNLINDVLDINRIEAGRMVLEKSEALFNKLIQEVVKENQAAADHKQISLNSEMPEDTLRVNVDVGKMERVIGELVSNAIKYTPENGQVDVKLSQKENGNIELSIRDTGIGMTTQECTEIWERFYRTAASQKFAVGSGLGLSIAKELVEMHDGTLAVESEVGKGSIFTMTLPI